MCHFVINQIIACSMIHASVRTYSPYYTERCASSIVVNKQKVPNMMHLKITLVNITLCEFLNIHTWFCRGCRLPYMVLNSFVQYVVVVVTGCRLGDMSQRHAALNSLGRRFVVVTGCRLGDMSQRHAALNSLVRVSATATRSNVVYRLVDFGFGCAVDTGHLDWPTQSV